MVKNIKKEDAIWIDQKRQKRKLDEGKETIFEFNGHPVKQANIKRHKIRARIADSALIPDEVPGKSYSCFSTARTNLKFDSDPRRNKYCTPKNDAKSPVVISSPLSTPAPLIGGSGSGSHNSSTPIMSQHFFPQPSTFNNTQSQPFQLEITPPAVLPMLPFNSASFLNDGMNDFQGFSSTMSQFFPAEPILNCNSGNAFDRPFPSEIHLSTQQSDQSIFSSNSHYFYGDSIGQHQLRSEITMENFNMGGLLNGSLSNPGSTSLEDQDPTLFSESLNMIQDRSSPKNYQQLGQANTAGWLGTTPSMSEIPPAHTQMGLSSGNTSEVDNFCDGTAVSNRRISLKSGDQNSTTRNYTPQNRSSYKSSITFKDLANSPGNPFSIRATLKRITMPLMIMEPLLIDMISQLKNEFNIESSDAQSKWLLHEFRMLLSSSHDASARFYNLQIAGGQDDEESGSSSFNLPSTSARCAPDSEEAKDNAGTTSCLSQSRRRPILHRDHLRRRVGYLHFASENWPLSISNNSQSFPSNSSVQISFCPNRGISQTGFSFKLTQVFEDNIKPKICRHITTFIVVDPRESPLAEAIWENNLLKVRNAISSRKASLFDVLPGGSSMLAVSVKMFWHLRYLMLIFIGCHHLL